ncbi:MAG TPA: c-type cytochrome [Noviherbaspirillum sp.]|uniref:c-type cytochrome n=1 Tax=Noviherbaspirillum sp. TaxID=1926288 RepID=UPI002B481ED0|nr:c-type cytochrome [Noviherbaspirillum sp.]HJV88651.1 c-type cytochrome [Noviherbaspirillum sp.]
MKLSLLYVALLAAMLTLVGQSMAANGKAVYDSTCWACHATGAAGSPKFGDKVAWEPRIHSGMQALYTSALKGKNLMPARGGNSSLTDADVIAAVDYMVSQIK